MRVLLVEDSPMRIGWFRRHLDGHVLDVTSRSTEAIVWLQRHTYDYIFLDHDLADQHYFRGPIVEGESPEARYNRLWNMTGTGRDVSKWLRDHPDVSPDAVICIHSLNETASQMMEEDLRARKAVCRKFGTFKITV